MSDAENKPPRPGATAFGYSGFGAAGGSGPKPPETPPPESPSPFAPPLDQPAPSAPPPPAAPPPATDAAPWPTAGGTPATAQPPEAAPWPQTDAAPQPPGTPPPAYGSAAPEASPVGYAPYGTPPGGYPPASGFAYPGAPSGAADPYVGEGAGPHGSPPPVGPSAMCAVHPETPAVGLCPRCGGYMCQWCQRINDFGEVFCATCMERVGYGTPVPWDRRQELGLFQAWWQTFKESMMKPDDFFARAAHGVSDAPPLLFAMICGWLGQIGYSVIRLAMSEQPVMILVSFATVPVGVLLSIYVGGGIAHLFAKMFGGTGSYAVTCRAWGFCHSPGALGLVPGLGALVAGFWTIVLEVYAVKHAHRISGGKAAAAVLLPLGIIVVLCCVGAVLIGAAAGAAMGGSRGGF